MPFAGVRHIEYVDDSFLACQMKLQQRIMDNNYVSLIFAAGQQADRMRNIFDRSTLYGIQATYAYDSILGPLSGSIGYSNKSREFYFFIDLGFDF
jgi:NTE family protein